MVNSSKTDLSSKYKNKKILVIGAGFIASHLISRLTQLGSETIVFSRTRRVIKDVPVTAGNIQNFQLMLNTIKKNFDIIFQCAGYSGTTSDSRQAQINFQSNIYGTFNILEAVRLVSPQSHVVLIGSRQEYGVANYIPVDEKHLTIPTNLYGVSKLISTHLAKTYSRTYDIATTVLRVSNVYGPHKNRIYSGYNVVNYFISQAKQGKSLLVFGSGSQLRDYLYISDLIEALLLVGVNPKAEAEIFNVGLGKQVTFRKIVQLIADTAHVTIKYVNWPVKYKQIETGDYVSNIKKIKEYIDWEPHISPEKGIQKCFL